MTLMEWMEFLSYAVTILGLPLAIAVFVVEQRKERANEEEALYQRLSDDYEDFLKLALDNADLKLFRAQSARGTLSEEQMPRRTQRLWDSWEDYIREWCRREDFRAALPQLLQGEDADFVRHVRRVAEEEARQGAGR